MGKEAIGAGTVVALDHEAAHAATKPLCASVIPATGAPEDASDAADVEGVDMADIDMATAPSHGARRLTNENWLDILFVYACRMR